MTLSLDERIILSLLKLDAQQTDLDAISQDVMLPQDVVWNNLRRIADYRLIQLEKGSIRISSTQRLDLAILAIKWGVDVERVCHVLGWQEFEDLVALVLEVNDFSTQKHFRFKNQDRRFEIDVLGVKKPLVFLVECKRWTRSWQRSATMKIVEKQIKRTEALLNSFQEVRGRLELDGWRDVWLLPLILTLSETPLKTYKKVPVIPIFYFHTFVTEEVNLGLNEVTFYKAS
jgi:Holliday junction resolvase-like predicted endonuclease